MNVSKITEADFAFNCSLRFYDEGTAVQINNFECLNGWYLRVESEKIYVGGMGWECNLGGEFTDISSAVNYINAHKDVRMCPWPG